MCRITIEDAKNGFYSSLPPTTKTNVRPFLYLVGLTFVYTTFLKQLGLLSSILPPPVQYQYNHKLIATSNHDPRSSNQLLPTCKSLMQAPHSPYRDGAFLTRHTRPIRWEPLADGSQRLHHSVCELHRYTAAEARQCLAGKHVTIVGDSLSRYQYLSLAWFLHRGEYPPRFERPPPDQPCLHINEQGQPTCSPPDQPNICMEIDWRVNNPKGGTRYTWLWLMQSLGDRDGVFGGHMEANGIRKGSKTEEIVENYLYVSPTHDQSHQTQPQPQQVILSYFNELGFSSTPLPLHGFQFTGCAVYGNCTFSDDLANQRFQRAAAQDWDWQQPLVQALNRTAGGILATSTALPPADTIVLYNRGLWSPVTEELAQQIMPLLFQYTNGGKCYFRSSTGHLDKLMPIERGYVKHETNKAGCGFIDFGHLVEDFANIMGFYHPWPPQDQSGHRVTDERSSVYWDALHFRPWVYEELNNMLLNIWCNAETVDNDNSRHDGGSSSSSAVEK